MPDKQTRSAVHDPTVLQADIERAREEITSSVLALRERVSQATDWREWVRRSPWISIALAMAAGLWLGIRKR